MDNIFTAYKIQWLQSQFRGKVKIALKKLKLLLLLSNHLEFQGQQFKKLCSISCLNMIMQYLKSNKQKYIIYL